MKKLFAITLLMAMALCGMGQAIHFDFSITNSTGYEIYYRITDTDLHQVVVTYPCQNGDNYWWGYDKPEGKLILMDTVTYNGTDYTLVGIDDYAFCGCSGLRGTFEFPESIQTIGAGAFKGCYNLSGNLVLPAVMTRIEDEAFSGCSSFTGKLVLPDSIQYVGNQAFLNCSGFRGMMMLPASLSFIGEQAFKGVTSINSISIKAKNVPTTADNTFDEIPTWITVNVPYDMKEAYQNVLGWSRFANNTVEKSIWTGNAEPWTKGNGTTDDPYLIESAENLAWLAKSVNERLDLEIGTGWSMGGGSWPVYTFHDMNIYQDTCFRMVIDIDLNKGSTTWASIGNTHTIDENVYNDGEINAPHYQNYHGYYYTYFCGQFDGNSHIISKAHYDSSKENIGLFGIIDNAIVSNLTIDDLLAHPYYGYTIGGLAARANNSIIYNCHTRGVIYNSNTGGGIVGIANKCRIERCSAQIDFTGSRVGGIAGIFVCDSTSNSQNGVFNCNYTGSINGAFSVGGILGLCQSELEGTGTSRIENCFSRCSMSKICPDPDHYVQTGNYIYGGIVGEVANIDSLCILNCYNNGTITTVPANIGNPQYYGSGILAYSNPNTTIYIKNCYHVGSIEAQHTGGIIAQNTNMTIVRNCFFDKTVAPDDGFGLPLESDYMKTEAFVQQLNNGSSVFKMDIEPYENDGYPVFGTDGLIFVGAEWYYQLQNDDGSITYQHLQCVGDTTIGNERPKIIVRTNTIYDRYDKTTVTHEYIYEENGVVYWWNQTLGKFTVLYDFGAEVGDEWTIEVGNETITTKVYATEVQYIDGIPYKKLAIADPNETFNGNLLSTIGHSTSFFPEKLMNQGKGFRVEGLRCYWLNGDLILKTTNDDCDAIYAELHNGINEDGPSTGSGTFAVYPNPTDGILFVQTLRATSLPDQTYRIINLMGQTLLTGNISAETQQIDISTLPAGMYFISVDGQTVKFVVK
ncbi:MAG: leucine-rich repeat domain-containing protein [bacterium]|nr:leucine-rich repeat domain-containing protein [bacterium]